MKNGSTEPIVHTKVLVVVGGQGNGDEEQLHRTDSAQKVLTGRQDLSNSMGLTTNYDIVHIEPGNELASWCE